MNAATAGAATVQIRFAVEVLLRIYAKCLDGGDEALRRRIERALGHD